MISKREVAGDFASGSTMFDKNRQAFNCLSNLILLQTCVDSYLAQQ